METLPLSGIRVADFGRVQAGPSATQWLSLWGAEVIRLESRARPDMLRGEPMRGRVEAEPDLNSGNAFLSLNCAKLSCTLNLTNPKGVDLAKRIIRLCDVVVENYSSGVMERFGLDYASLKRLRPDVIMLSNAGPGQTGPNRKEVAFAQTVQAFIGLCSITGYPGGSPVQFGPMWADVVSGQVAAFAILTALYHRDMTGEGQYIDQAMNEAMLVTMPEAIMDYTMNGRIRGPQGNRDDIMAPHGAYPCQGDDQWVAIAVADEEQWRAFCQVLGNPAWCADAKFADQVSRWQNQDELDQRVAEWTKQHTAEEAMRILQRAGIAAGFSARPQDHFEDPHLKDRGFLVEVTHPRLGTGQLTRLPFRLDGEYVSHYESAPLLGQHNAYVLCELLGIPEGEVETLMGEKIVY